MLSTTRRALLLGALAAAISAGVQAQADFPSRPIKVIVGFGAGGTADTIARLYGQKMAEVLHTPVVIDNKPGGNQMAAIRALQASAPDGYTLYAATKSSLTQNPGLRKDIGYDPLKDFSLIGLATTVPGLMFVNTELPVRSIDELVAYAKAHPGKLNYASAGVGSADHLATEALMSITGVQMTHIPYKSGADEIRETIAGNVHFVITPMVSAIPFVKSGKIRPLAVTAAQRAPQLPDVPSVTETGIQGLAQLQPHTFIAFAGPASMPPLVVERLNAAINKVSAMPEVAALLRDAHGSEPATSTPASFRQLVEADIARWRAFGKSVKLPD
ncbi:MAG TPA: tripartite tricarboxylate transporter substrate binding protein [Variovorax sp.]|nr:tripartite tricarboxylate transporter substrate binding protein [Variovorax sp.]